MNMYNSNTRIRYTQMCTMVTRIVRYSTQIYTGTPNLLDIGTSSGPQTLYTHTCWVFGAIGTDHSSMRCIFVLRVYGARSICIFGLITMHCSAMVAVFISSQCNGAAEVGEGSSCLQSTEWQALKRLFNRMRSGLQYNPQCQRLDFLHPEWRGWVGGGSKICQWIFP